MSSVKELSAKSKDIFAGTSLSPRERQSILRDTSYLRKNMSFAKKMAQQSHKIKQSLKSPKYNKLTAEEKKYYALLPIRQFRKQSFKVGRYNRAEILKPKDYLDQAKMKVMLRNSGLPNRNKKSLMGASSVLRAGFRKGGMSDLKQIIKELQKFYKYVNQSLPQANKNKARLNIYGGKKANNVLKK